MSLFKYIFFQILKSIFLILMFLSYSHAANIKNSATVFMYHKFGVSKYPSTSVTINQLENHITELTKDKYNILPLNFIVDAIINDANLPENTIGISIDDADESFFEVAWPLFKKNNIPVTLFVTTGTIVNNNKNYLNWDEIRKLKEEGVTIGAHSHTHAHMPDLSIDEVKKEIEISNKIFLKELGEIPSLFAYPYGETSNEIIDLIKNYKFKVAFGQHSGIINETSNMYYLPRFSLNEKYGEIDRVKFAASSKGLGVYDFIPTSPTIKENPPFIGFSLLDERLSTSLNCFIFDMKGQVEKEIFKFNERVEIRLKRELSKGRSRINCTAKDSQGNWRWFGHQFYY
jgi:peptidoglycan/xylan/chitin deacetylase (PgdA/CDA1 family)|tara:strand:+ start:243 stop:1274 length:1032 start_codon:yes stop_codon:yes gene_type:complete